MIKEINYTATVKEFYCDFCDKKAEKKCEICGKDLCKDEADVKIVKIINNFYNILNMNKG